MGTLFTKTPTQTNIADVVVGLKEAGKVAPNAILATFVVVPTMSGKVKVTTFCTFVAVQTIEFVKAPVQAVLGAI